MLCDCRTMHLSFFREAFYPVRVYDTVYHSLGFSLPVALVLGLLTSESGGIRTSPVLSTAHRSWEVDREDKSC